MQPIFISPTLRVDRLVLGPYGTNSYLLTCLETAASLVIDAPAEAEKILEHLRGTTPRMILLTHGHFDHTGALVALKTALGVPVVAHRQEGPSLPLEPDHFCVGGETLSLGLHQIEVLHTPGHTPGSLCFRIGRLLFAGDTLFPGGPGNTRTPADFQQILATLSNQLFLLPDETRVFPGHGEPTTIGNERPAFEAFLARPHDPGLCGDVLWASC